jgi:hypothetical protein
MLIQGCIVMHRSALGPLYVMAGHTVIAVVPISCEWRAVCTYHINNGSGSGLFWLAEVSHLVNRFIVR